MREEERKGRKSIVNRRYVYSFYRMRGRGRGELGGIGEDDWERNGGWKGEE